MEYDELRCPICEDVYNETDKTPRLLITCGHTFCHYCIQRKLLINNVIQCPEDFTTYENVASVESLPKNISLLKLITRATRATLHNFPKEKKGILHKNSGPEVTTANDNELSPGTKSKVKFEEEDFCGLKNQKEETVKVTNFNELLKTMNMTSNENPSSEIFPSKTCSDNNITSIRASLRKSSTAAHYNPSPAKNKLRSCPYHPNRLLEIICIDHHTKICTNCALFGEHRNHNIINEEDFMKEIEVKAEIIIDLYELIDQNLSSFSPDSLVNNKDKEKTSQLLQKIDKKYSEITFTIQDFSNEFIRKMKDYEKLLMEMVSAKFEAFKNKIQVIGEIPKELMEKCANWKNIVQKKLDTLNEITDASEECLKLIETDPQQSHNVLIENAEGIISEFVKLRSFPIDLIEKSIDEVNVDINYELANDITKVSDPGSDKVSFAFDHQYLMQVHGLTASENIDRALVLDEDEKKIASKLNKNNMNISIVPSNTSHIATNAGVSDIHYIDDTNSFMNLSEDSAILKISNSILGQNKKKDTEHISTDKTHTIATRSNNAKHTKGNAGSTLNTIKFPGNSNLRVEKSKSPPRTPTPDKDRIVFIKSQFKCESANFTGYDIGDEGAKLISEMILNKALSSKVKELKLTKTNLTDEGALIIFKALEAGCSNISSINIAKNYITDKSTDGIISMLNKNKMLKTVYVSNNSFSAGAKEKIKACAGNAKAGVKIFI